MRPPILELTESGTPALPHIRLDRALQSEFSIQLDVTGMEESRLTTIAAKLGELPFVTRAYWHYA